MDEWENWETVSIEAELDKLRDERGKKESLEPSATATGTNSGCARILIGLLIGLTVLTTICLLLTK
jgi:hypothetical protein